jgi:hypothetical protein
MPDWSELLKRVSLVERDRAEQQKELRRQAEAKAELDAWTLAVVPKVMEEFAHVARMRAADFHSRTGRMIAVAHPVHARIDIAPVLPFHVVALRLDLAEVDVYSARNTSGLPALHMVSLERTSAGTPPRDHRLVSIPGCIIACKQDNSPVLLRMDKTGDEITMDEIAYAAFELLISRWQYWVQSHGQG